MLQVHCGRSPETCASTVAQEGEHMDVESGLVIGHSQRERKRSYRDFLLDVDDVVEQDSSDQEFSTTVTHKEPGSPLAEYWDYLNDKHNSFESTFTSHYDFVTNPIAHHRPYPIISMPGLQTTTKSPMTYMEAVPSFSGPTTDQASVSHSSPECGDVSGADLVVVNAAAHLHLMGESLALIGHELQETDKAVCASSSMSLLMDSMLCALVPLVSLTSLMPEFRGVPQHTLADAMENIAYMMPGL
ncbi:unnamed protein product [Lota lota]